MNFFDYFINCTDYKALFMRRWYVYYFLALIIVLVGIYFYAQEHPPSVEQFQLTDKELAIKADLEKELSSLEPMPGILYGPVHSSGGRGHDFWSVSTSFEAELPFSEVYHYYDNQFRAHGWKETSVRAKVAHYKKNFYEAEIGEYEDKHNQYYIGLTWWKSSERQLSAVETVMGVIFIIVMPCLLIGHFVSLIRSYWKGRK